MGVTGCDNMFYIMSGNHICIIIIIYTCIIYLHFGGPGLSSTSPDRMMRNVISTMRDILNMKQLLNVHPPFSVLLQQISTRQQFHRPIATLH